MKIKAFLFDKLIWGLVGTLVILSIPVLIYLIWGIEVFWLINSAICISFLTFAWVVVAIVLTIASRIRENKEERNKDVDHSESYPRTLTDETIGKITFTGAFWTKEKSIPLQFRGRTFRLKVEGPSAEETKVFEKQKVGFSQFLQINEEVGDLVVEAVWEWCKTHPFLPNTFLPSRLLISPCGETAIIGLISSRKGEGLFDEPPGIAVVVNKSVSPLVYDGDEYEDRVYEEAWS